MTRPPFRADHVGSLLRPQSLLGLRRTLQAQDEDAARRLRAHEDECIAAVVARQEAVGLQSITDGEYRRESFHGDFISRLDNIEFKLFDPGGRSGGAPFVAVVSGRIGRPPEGIEIANFEYLRSLTNRTAKQTLPSPTMTHFRGGREAIEKRAYPEMAEFFADLARVYREEISGLARAGCRYLQLDDTNLAYLCDPRMRAGAAERGENVERLPNDYAALINDSIRGRPADLAVCVHLCRGNARSQWFAEGGYEPVAEVLFNTLDADGFLLEYDDERSGDFSPLRFVPRGKRIVLGLLTSKRGALESKDAIKRRIDEAAAFIDLDQLCLSPQCGFASAAGGNLLSEAEQWRKLERVVDVAAEVWGQ